MMSASKTSNVRFVLAAILGATAVIVGVALSVAGQSDIPVVAGYPLPNDLADDHFQLTVPPASLGAPLISSSQAVDLAKGYAAGLAESPKDVSVQYVMFTDRRRGYEQADGSVMPEFSNLPVWIVRFRGVPQPVFGGLSAVGGVQGQAHELNVVVDARTGAYVEMFSFQ